MRRVTRVVLPVAVAAAAAGIGLLSGAAARAQRR
jgi:hypothetical protein